MIFLFLLLRRPSHSAAKMNCIFAFVVRQIFTIRRRPNRPSSEFYTVHFLHSKATIFRIKIVRRKLPGHWTSTSSRRNRIYLFDIFRGEESMRQCASSIVVYGETGIHRNMLIKHKYYYWFFIFILCYFCDSISHFYSIEKWLKHSSKSPALPLALSFIYIIFC